jgi:hypothetical protein
MSISNYLEGKLLDLVFTNTTFPAITTVYGSLHTADPGETGTGSPLASCARVAIAFNAAGSATSVNATTVDFVTSATGTITHIALWDGSATATANCLWYGALTASKNVNAGDTIRLSSAQLAVNLD